MSSNLSVAETLAHLEAKIAHHKEQQGLHERQEAFHAEQKVIHEAEHRKSVERFEAFKAASAAVGEILMDVKPSAPPSVPPAEDIETGDWRWLSRLMSRVLETKSVDETFGASTIVKEIQARWGAKLRHRVDPRSVSATLRRWATAGRIHLVRDGRSYYESLYTRRRQPPAEDPA
jgi:hypothetical protein